MINIRQLQGAKRKFSEATERLPESGCKMGFAIGAAQGINPWE